MLLTDTAIRGVKPTDKPQKLFDGNGNYRTNGGNAPNPGIVNMPNGNDTNRLDAVCLAP